MVGSQVQLNMARNEYTVLGTVKGTSTLDSYVFGIVQVIDGDKYSILGIGPFEDQLAFSSPGEGWVASTIIDRAYFKALAASPDADAVMPKSCEQTYTGTPFISSTRVVTFTGKAVKYKAD